MVSWAGIKKCFTCAFTTPQRNAFKRRGNVSAPREQAHYQTKIQETTACTLRCGATRYLDLSAPIVFGGHENLPAVGGGAILGRKAFLWASSFCFRETTQYPRLLPRGSRRYRLWTPSGGSVARGPCGAVAQHHCNAFLRFRSQDMGVEVVLVLVIKPCFLLPVNDRFFRSHTHREERRSERARQEPSSQEDKREQFIRWAVSTLNFYSTIRS